MHQDDAIGAHSRIKIFESLQGRFIEVGIEVDKGKRLLGKILWKTVGKVALVKADIVILWRDVFFNLGD